MIPERFSVLGFFYPGMNPASHKKCVAISGNFPECIFVSRFPGSILVKNGASGCPFWDCLFLSKLKCAHALLPFWHHSGIERIRRRMFWVHSRNNNPQQKWQIRGILAAIASRRTFCVVLLMDSFQFWQSVVSVAGNDSIDAHNTWQTT